MRKVYPQEDFIVPVAERCVQDGWYSNLNRADLVTNPIMYGRRYVRADDEVFDQAVREIFHQVLEENPQDFLAAVSKAGAEARAWLYVFLYQEDPKNAELLLNYFDESAKAGRNVLIQILQRCPELHDKVSLKLNSKKAAQRELAIDILSEYNNEESRQSLRTAMDNEKSAKLLEKLRTVINTESGKAVNDTQQLAAELIKGNKKNILAWIYANPMPEVKKKDGTIASQDYLCALMLSYAGMNVLGVSKTAAQLAEELEKESLGVFALEVFERWLAEGAQAKKKWVLYFASIHGSAEIVPALKKQILQWPDLSRSAIAAEAVFALALHPGDGALMAVDSMSRKCKFRQVKKAAGDALSYAAKELGITVEQLSDRIVPDLGFDENCQQIVDYGKRSFTVYLTPALELEIFDEKGKKLKSMPAPGKTDEQKIAQDAYNAFKQMKKDMKTTVSAQKLRLELALSSDRKWTVQEWTDLFVRKPIMHQFAIGLIWGLYIEGKVSQTFRYMEDGTFNTADEEELELPENGMIGLIHPLELNAEVKEQWKTQLEDYEIEQPILQLERPVYLVEDAEKSLKELERFGGKVINSMSLTGKMQNGGWSRGPAMDGGMMYYFYVENEQLNVGAHLNIKGMYAGLDPDEYTTLQTVQFYQVSKVKEHLQEVYDKLKDDDCIENGEVPGRFFSETIYQLTKVATASTGTIEEDWRN
ncbi:MAG: DUF4132 domain-containing protein [Firmicutes bacterium]|nr:DUF4132 domain-containing protein [Bacillota bacterium]